MPEEQERAGLSKEQKMGVILLSVFSVFAVGLGILKIRNTVYAPFSLNKQIPNLKVSGYDINSNESLIYRDTDKDGLNDFDELYVYSTSAYLADTDSDGIPDKSEVDKGTNPICPEGKNCAEAGINGDAMPTNPLIASATATLGLPPSPQDLNKILNDPAGIRKVLLDSGLDKKIIDATSDADLMNMVKEALNTTSTINSQ